MSNRPRRAALRPPAPAVRTEWLRRFRHRVTGRRFTPVRVALGLAAIAELGVGATLLATRNETPPPSGRASTPCSTPIVPPPRVDPTGLGCGVPAGYRSGVLTLGANSWSLGDDVVDGRLVDTDADGWSELVALRDTGEVFLVRRFPTEASQPVRVRSVASVPGADRVTVTNGISGPAAVGLRLPDGSVVPLNEAISVSTAPATPQAGSS